MKDLDSMKIYKKIELLTQKQGLTFYKVAKTIGISNAAFSTWKNGRNRPSMRALQKLAKFFGVRIEFFLN